MPHRTKKSKTLFFRWDIISHVFASWGKNRAVSICLHWTFKNIMGVKNFKAFRPYLSPRNSAAFSYLYRRIYFRWLALKFSKIFDRVRKKPRCSARLPSLIITSAGSFCSNFARFNFIFARKIYMSLRSRGRALCHPLWHCSSCTSTSVYDLPPPFARTKKNISTQFRNFRSAFQIN